MLQATLDEMDFDAKGEVKWLSITQNDGMEVEDLKEILSKLVKLLLALFALLKIKTPGTKWLSRGWI